MKKFERGRIKVVIEHMNKWNSASLLMGKYKLRLPWKIVFYLSQYQKFKHLIIPSGGNRTYQFLPLYMTGKSLYQCNHYFKRFWNYFILHYFLLQFNYHSFSGFLQIPKCICNNILYLKLSILLCPR